MIILNLKKNWLFFLPVSILLACCQQKDPEYTVIHLVAANYEGPLIESLQKEGSLLNRSGDTIFVNYDERGVAVYRDTLVHFSGIVEKYFYSDGGKIISDELTIKKNEYYHGVCINDRPFYSVIVRYKDFKTPFKAKQKALVKEYICNQ